MEEPCVVSSILTLGTTMKIPLMGCFVLTMCTTEKNWVFFPFPCYTYIKYHSRMFERKAVVAIAEEKRLTAPDFVSPTFSSDEASWADEHSEGQLAVDVFETENDLVVVATMAGTRVEDIELHLQNDFLTIRGERHPPIAGSARVFYEECYWGRFSRTIVLPVDVASEMARSEYKNGVLIVTLPKVRPKQPIPILVVEE